MKRQTSVYFCGLLIVGLTALVAARPWGQLNQAVGIATAMDSVQADSVYLAGRDSLMVEDVAVMLPLPIIDTVVATVDAHQKRNAFLKEQDTKLKRENLRLEAQLKQRKQELQAKQQALVSLGDIDALLSKQNPKGQDSKSLEVSDLESELNQRSRGRKNHP